MALQTRPQYDFNAYLAAEREAVDSKHEYVAGQVFAMTGASYNHNVIVANIVRTLGNQLLERPCTVISSDMRVRISTADAAKYPDVIALCEAPQFYDGRHDVLLNPTLLVEVLSPSTEAYDRGGKFALYRGLESLQEYVLIAQERPSVEVFTRQADGRWLLSAYAEPEAQVEFESIQCRIPLREIYHRVRFDQADSSAAPSAP